MSIIDRLHGFLAHRRPELFPPLGPTNETQVGQAQGGTVFRRVNRRQLLTLGGYAATTLAVAACMPTSAATIEPAAPPSGPEPTQALQPAAPPAATKAPEPTKAPSPTAAAKELVPTATSTAKAPDGPGDKVGQDKEKPPSVPLIFQEYFNDPEVPITVGFQITEAAAQTTGKNKVEFDPKLRTGPLSMSRLVDDVMKATCPDYVKSGKVPVFVASRPGAPEIEYTSKTFNLKEPKNRVVLRFADSSGDPKAAIRLTDEAVTHREFLLQPNGEGGEDLILVVPLDVHLKEQAKEIVNLANTYTPEKVAALNRASDAALLSDVLNQALLVGEYTMLGFHKEFPIAYNFDRADINNTIIYDPKRQSRVDAYNNAQDKVFLPYYRNNGTGLSLSGK